MPSIWPLGYALQSATVHGNCATRFMERAWRRPTTARQAAAPAPKPASISMPVTPCRSSSRRWHARRGAAAPTLFRRVRRFDSKRRASRPGARRHHRRRRDQAEACHRYRCPETVGVDLVAMCVNILSLRRRAAVLRLFATGRLDPLRGARRGHRGRLGPAGAALIEASGRNAGVLRQGFRPGGLCRRCCRARRSATRPAMPGDVVLAMPSGVHNGFRYGKVVADHGLTHWRRSSRSAQARRCSHRHAFMCDRA